MQEMLAKVEYAGLQKYVKILQSDGSFEYSVFLQEGW